VRWWPHRNSAGGAAELRAIAAGATAFATQLRLRAPRLRREAVTAWLHRLERRFSPGATAAGPIAVAIDAASSSHGHRVGPRGVNRRELAAAGLLLLAVALAVAIGPSIHATGGLVESVPLELGMGGSPADARSTGAATEDADGYRVEPMSGASVTVPLSLPKPLPTQDSRLRVWAYGPAGVTTTVVLHYGDGVTRSLGRAGDWQGKVFDVTDAARRGAVSISARAENRTSQSQLFLDRLLAQSASDSAGITASRWAVGLLVLAIAIALLSLSGRLRRHWPLGVVLTATTVAVWPQVAGRAYDALPADSALLWGAAIKASWVGLDDGLLCGSWGPLSALSVQLFHLLTPFVGTAPGAARSASLLTPGRERRRRPPRRGRRRGGRARRSPRGPAAPRDDRAVRGSLRRSRDGRAGLRDGRGDARRHGASPGEEISSSTKPSSRAVTAFTSSTTCRPARSTTSATSRPTRGSATQSTRARARRSSPSSSTTPTWAPRRPAAGPTPARRRSTSSSRWRTGRSASCRPWWRACSIPSARGRPAEEAYEAGFVKQAQLVRSGSRALRTAAAAMPMSRQFVSSRSAGLGGGS